MKKILLTLLGILLVGTFVSANIYINEFESNPSSGSEWVEIYNNGSSVDLTGWKLYDGLATPSLKYAFTETINNEDFLVIDVSGLNNEGEFLTLKDDLDVLIDQTPTLVDNDNDVNTWQRIPDGTGSFEFRESTKGERNALPFVTATQHLTAYIVNSSTLGESTTAPECAIQNKNLIFRVNVSWGECSSGEVWLETNINGSFTNYSADYIGGQNYEVELNSSNLVEGIIYFQFFAKDCFNVTYNNSIKSIYINSGTMLSVSPPNPDGLNDWYVTEPIFTLTNPNATQVSYQWNSAGIPESSSSPFIFGMENVPNMASDKGIKLFLKYWSDVCDEEMQQEEFFVDLLDPEFRNFVPFNNSKVNSVSEISVIIDNVIGEQSSGVDESSIVMKVDDVPVSFTTSFEPGLNLKLTHTPVGLTDGIHTIFVSAKDNAGNYGEAEWSFELNEEFIELEVYSPEETIYNERRIPINISLLGKEAKKLEYQDNNGGWRTLCRNCDEYGFSRKKAKSFYNGEHNLTIKTTDEFDNTNEVNVSFFTDSRDPRISKTETEKTNLTNWDFIVEFREDNPKKLILHYDGSFEELNLSKCVIETSRTTCKVNLDLSGHEGLMEYYFYLEDIAGNNDTSRIEEMIVDTTKPKIENVSLTFDKGRVNFFVNVTEENFDEVIYYYMDDGMLRDRRLCSRLDEGICEKRVSFRDGEYNLTIKAVDEFGNYDEENVSFFIDSKEPRIIKTEPRRNDFTNGSDFYLKFKEENPEEIKIIVNGTEFPLNFSTCIIDGSYTGCYYDLNLSDYNGEKIEYYFEIKDRVNNTDTSREVEVDVDTDSPEINNPTSFYWNDSNYIYFNISIKEANLDEVVLNYEYERHGKIYERERTLCTRLKDGICEKKFRYKDYYENYQLTILDEAGNSAMFPITLI